MKYVDQHLICKVTYEHSGEKPLSCDVCGSSFLNCSNLKVHMHTHTGEKPFPYEICGSTSKNYSSFKQHMQTRSGEKPFSCKVCGSAFPQNSYLKTHIRTHSGDNHFLVKSVDQNFQTAFFNSQIQKRSGAKQIYGSTFPRFSI